jgi:translocation and assembly module TamA
VRDTVAASLGLARWESYADMTGDLFDRLAREAIDEAREAAATEGYFSAQVSIEVDRATKPADVTVHVAPGPASRVGKVDIDVTGPARDEPAGTQAIADVREGWRLPLGTIFRQAAWDEAKTRAVATLAARRYAAARLTQSRADVDPAAQSAALSVTLDSGPPFHVGAIEVTGVRRYSADLVRNYSTLHRGDPYSLEELDQYVRRLTATGYFASVHAAIDSDPAHAADAPVTVAVIEAPPKRLELGVGFSTDTRVRFNLSYRDVDFAARALQLATELRLEQKLQSGSVTLTTPPAANGWSQSGNASIERTDLAGLVSETATLGYRRTSLDERNQWQYGPALYFDTQRPQGAPRTSAHALYVDVQRAWRRMDDLVSPTRGTMTLVELGAGVPGASTEGFVRGIARFQGWRPLPGDNGLIGRLEAGAVLAKNREGVPGALLFRTGGDQSVRGYAYQSLGLREGDATLPARYYTLASLEAVHWFNDYLGGAVFVDAGDAFDEIDAMRIAVGVGAGARVRTPIGPLRLDLAYGERTRAVRVHFSAGLAF